MAANVETMFYTREKPWHGLGIRVAEALTSKEALTKAGLDWHVVQELDMRQPAVCRRVEEYGYWLNFPTNTLSGVTGSAPIWCFRKGLFAGALIKGHAEKAVS